MLNGIFVFVALVSILLAAYTDATSAVRAVGDTTQMQALTNVILTSARNAVDLAIGLIGVMAFFLGLMKVAEHGGLMASISRAVSPIMRLLFPSIPSESPAMGAMVMNISANMLGLGNAATPFGIKAIEELNKYNSRTGTATNAMVLFLAINTAGLAILPTGVIGVRAALGSADPSGIFFPTWFASGCATIVGITMAIMLSRIPRYRATEPPPLPLEIEPNDARISANLDASELPVKVRAVPTRRWLSLAFWVSFAALAVRDVITRLETESAVELTRSLMSYWILPALVAMFILYGWVRQVRVYESLVEGAKEGFQVAIRIIPYLVAILVVVGMFRASGGLEILGTLVGPFTSMIGMPGEALPMAVLRPLSGSGALGVASEAMTAHGPDSLIGYMVSTYQGSTETTFYVLAVYYGAIGVRETRHTIPTCLLADAAGILGATFIVNRMFG